MGLLKNSLSLSCVKCSQSNIDGADCLLVFLSFQMQVSVSDRHRPRKKQKLNRRGKGREWVMKKKEQMRRKGNVVPPDSKYTARKRKSRF